MANLVALIWYGAIVVEAAPIVLRLQIYRSVCLLWLPYNHGRTILSNPAAL